MEGRSNIDSLLSQKQSLQNTPTSEHNRIAIIREATYFSIETDDNPYMTQALNQMRANAELAVEEQFKIEQARQKDLDKEKFFHDNIPKAIEHEKMKLKQQANEQHQQLLAAYKKYKIPYFTLLPEKGKLKNGSFSHKTDEVFATDTGQYFFDNEQLHFIPGNFANPQRFGEQRLAIPQAMGTFNAKVNYLTNATDGNLLKFEGGDIRQVPGRKLMFVGYGHRNDASAAQTIKNIMPSSFTVIPVELLQENFYHLDCCFLPLPNDCALMYEGEFELDADNKPIMEKSDPNNPQSPLWPKLVEGTATMSLSSRKQVRQFYDADHLILITKAEALNFGANAVIMRTQLNEQEQDVMFIAQNALTAESLEQVKGKTKITIEEISFNIMHFSGGSVRCVTQEVPCSSAFLNTLMRKSVDDLCLHHSRLFYQKPLVQKEQKVAATIDNADMNFAVHKKM